MTPSISSAIDRFITVFVTWLLTYLTSKGIITTADAAAFLPILLALPAAAWGLYQNRQKAIIQQAAMIAKDPESPLKALVMADSMEGRELARAESTNAIVTAGSVQAAEVARSGT